MEQLRSPLPPAEVPAAPRARPRRWRLLRRPLLWAGALGLCFAAGLLLAPRLFPRTSTAWRSPQVVTALPSMSPEANAFNEAVQDRG